MTIARVAPVVLWLMTPTGCAAHRGWFTEPDLPGGGAQRALALEPTGRCPKQTGAGPVVVLVHGIGGETANMAEVREVLGGLDPAAVVSFRWSPLEQTGPLVGRFADGLSALARCGGSAQPVITIAHSAGGVLASLAASRVELPPAARAQPLVVVTVASPLAGAGYDSWRMRLLPVEPFAVTVGGRFAAYPAAAHGVRVVHLRTHPRGDHVMRPTREGHRPDDPRAVVPGAHVHALPEEVGHDEALLWAARALVDAPDAFGLSRRAPD